MKPLSSELWVVSACFFILLGFVIWILEHGTNEEFQGSTGQQIGTTFWFALSTLVYAHSKSSHLYSHSGFVTSNSSDTGFIDCCNCRGEASE